MSLAALPSRNDVLRFRAGPSYAKGVLAQRRWNFSWPATIGSAGPFSNVLRAPFGGLIGFIVKVMLR
jgi:hypothetical protein